MIHSQPSRQRVPWFPRLAAAFIVAWLPWQETALAQSRSSATAELSQQLEQPVTLTWQGQELAPALERLADTQRIAIWLDRRVDPSSPVELSASNRPLRETLAAALTPPGWAASPYHGVLYIGPEQTARELLTLSALARRSLDQAPAEVRSKWLRAEAWSFPRLSEPRSLIAGLVKSAGAQARDDQRIPHDLWPARGLPPMATLDRVILLLAGFDLTCKLSADGRQCRIVPIERPVQITSGYTVSAARSAAVDAVLEELAEATATRRGTRLTLAATVEQHDRVRAAIQGKSKAPQAQRRPAPVPTSRDDQRFTLKITNQPVGPVIDQLARQLKLNVDWAAPVGTRNTLVSCEVREATLDELLSAILSAAELTFALEGDEVTITSAK
jgi:hypothetical protein